MKIFVFFCKIIYIVIIYYIYIIYMIYNIIYNYIFNKIYIEFNIMKKKYVNINKIYCLSIDLIYVIVYLIYIN